ncbi:hypothetical protein I4U23_031423 [Adineta vaga]|nr:hypothetical protein I4U23_031423 [Adineta vaga]
MGTVICLQSLTDCIQSTIGQYIYSYYLVNFNKTHDNATSNDAEIWAQEQSADLVFKKDIFCSLPLILITFLLANSALWSNFLWYLLNKPFNWSSIQIGHYNSVRSILIAIFSILGMKVFTLMSIHDSIICSFSHTCLILISIWFIFAKQNWHLYLTLCLIPFLDYQKSLTWSMITKYVTENEYHFIFTILTMINTICTILGNGFFNWIYELTVNHLSYLIFIITIGLSIIPLILNIFLFITNRRSSSLDINEEDDDSDLIDWNMMIEESEDDLIII